MEIEWRDPPENLHSPKGFNRTGLNEFIEDLKKHPDRWAAFKSLPANEKNRQKLQGLRSRFIKNHNVEATVRLENDNITLFVRWPIEKEIENEKLG